jgi:DNA-binding CsgD family transcriptional regulator
MIPEDSGQPERRPISLCWDRPMPDHCLRDTGIPLIGRIPWATHICMFCDSKRDMLDAVTAYFAPAQQANEYCLWVVSDPLTTDEAKASLRKSFSSFDKRLKEGSFEIIAGQDWYYKNGRFDFAGAVKGWHKRAAKALTDGFDGIRGFGNPLWRKPDVWHTILDYERAVEATLTNQPIILLCAYITERSTSADVLDVGQTHQCVIARRKGRWEYLGTPGDVPARQEIAVLNDALAALPPRLMQERILSDREKVVLAQIIRGNSSKKTARILGISPRTVDFHRARIMHKLGARNAAELVRKVLADI